MAIVGNTPAASTDPAERRIVELHRQAIAQGKEAQFLKSRPKYAQKLNSGELQAPEGSSAGGAGGFGNMKALGRENARLPNVLKQGAEYSDETNRMATKGQNVGSISGPTGTSSGGFGDDGRYHIKTELSGGQSDVLSGVENVGIGALGAAGNNISGYQKFDWQGSPEERARIEEEVYGRMTRNLDRDRDRDFEAMEQRMHNRGIPLDPSNPAYQRELQAINERYDTARADARSRAVEMGGGEMSRSFGMAHTAHGQTMADTGQFYGMGSGAYMGTPELGFQPSDYVQQDPGAMWSNWRGQNISRDLTREQMNKNSGGGGGGGSSQPAPPSRPPIVGN
jgi:hypothetical protein